MQPPFLGYEGKEHHDERNRDDKLDTGYDMLPYTVTRMAWPAHQNAQMTLESPAKSRSVHVA